MVTGLERFIDHFQNFTDVFVLIGGTACDLWMGSIAPYRLFSAKTTP